MYYVINKFQFSLNSIFFGFMMLLVIKRTQCQLGVSMVTEKGLVEIAPSIIEIRNGANLSLICRIVNKEDEKLHNLVVWTKHVKKRKFSIINSDNESLGVNLSFTPIGLQHQGAYSCISPKYKVAKSVYVSIRLDPLRIDTFKPKHFSPRRKRSDNDDGYSFAQLDDLSFESVQKVVDEFLRRYPANQPPDWSTRDDNYNGYGNTDYNRNYNNDHSEEPYRPSKLAILCFVFIGGMAVFVLVVSIYKCCKNPETRQVDSDFTQGSYTASSRNPNSIFERNNNSSSQNRDSNTPLTATVHANRDFLDLPPTYADSAENSRASSMHNLNEIAAGPPTNASNGDCNTLPPTYEEAVVNLVPSAPPGSAPSAPPCDSSTDCNVENAPGSRAAGDPCNN